MYNEFITALKAELQQHADNCKIQVRELTSGGETLTDVYIDFSSEANASMMLKKLDNLLLMGRQLQIELVQMG